MQHFIMGKALTFASVLVCCSSQVIPLGYICKCVFEENILKMTKINSGMHFLVSDVLQGTCGSKACPLCSSGQGSHDRS